MIVSFELIWTAHDASKYQYGLQHAGYRTRSVLLHIQEYNRHDLHNSNDGNIQFWKFLKMVEMILAYNSLDCSVDMDFQHPS